MGTWSLNKIEQQKSMLDMKVLGLAHLTTSATKSIEVGRVEANAYEMISPEADQLKTSI